MCTLLAILLLRPHRPVSVDAVDYRIGEHHAHTLAAECCETLGQVDEPRRYRELADEFVRSTGYVPR